MPVEPLAPYDASERGVSCRRGCTGTRRSRYAVWDDPDQLAHASLLLRAAPTPVVDSRLSGVRGLACCTLPTGTSFDVLLERAFP